MNSRTRHSGDVGHEVAGCLVITSRHFSAYPQILKHFTSTQSAYKAIIWLFLNYQGTSSGVKHLLLIHVLLSGLARKPGVLTYLSTPDDRSRSFVPFG